MKTKLRGILIGGSLWIPAFAGMTEGEYAHFTIVIPAKAGIQLSLRRTLVSPKRLGEGGSSSCRALSPA
ncbi:MAG: hypothetical protein PHV34_12185 [Verrucomicrobiae bacterium]|nr:hypothetical protein [Verrucomicrobiae bacterium]